MIFPRRISLIIGIILILAGAAVFAWSVWPLPRTNAGLALGTDVLAVRGGSIEGRTVRLEYPAEIRMGEVGNVSLTLAPEQSDVSRSAKTNVEAEVWLDLPGASAVPADIVRTAVLPGRANRFDWQIRSVADQDLDGRAWVYFRLIPSDGSAEERRPVSAQPLRIRVISLLGMDEGTARWVGVGCVVSGMIVAGWGLGLVGRKNRPRRAPLKSIK